jgi:hypothetical protein
MKNKSLKRKEKKRDKSLFKYLFESDEQKVNYVTK